MRSLASRARLSAANGSADNQVILTFSAGRREESLDPEGGAGFNSQLKEVLRLMDRWLTNIEADPSADNGLARAARHKPPELVDACFTASGEKISEPQTHPGTGRCNQLFPSHTDPRMAAGAPLAGDVLKCTLKPVDPEDYTQSLTSDQLRRLKKIFPQGVCDYSRPGIGQEGSRCLAPVLIRL